MKKLSFVTVCFVLGISVAYGAEKTWTGRITDSMCGANHKAMAGGKMSDRECTLACIKSGQRYALAANGHVYTIENQNFAGLQRYAGDQVTVTGELAPDAQSIKVSKLQPVGK